MVVGSDVVHGVAYGSTAMAIHADPIKLVGILYNPVSASMAVCKSWSSNRLVSYCQLRYHGLQG